ncbi:hypothetical protein X760_31250 [Mesorhizobium sp. LSHC422A00]|nr:hypothetical protein X760_31250 [Mesorhizobium sp. LSHC422A00]
MAILLEYACAQDAWPILKEAFGPMLQMERFGLEQQLMVAGCSKLGRV